ncbi:MAG: CHAT domain-containing protein [Planctomycetota bacterium]|nr:MAG: CHAT domain-containing protein [Planctomycetota bacterium]REK18108.1 MAG: CHAT domain-containing protein [Planctomycetota bacterium]REK44223.1 MAG: CHAT domain-containing protein [Planctomycetota bacterium]
MVPSQNPSTLLVLLACGAFVSLAVTGASAADLSSTLRVARAHHVQGHYGQAFAELSGIQEADLAGVSGPAALAYWDLLADLYTDSGLIEEALRACREHQRLARRVPLSNVDQVRVQLRLAKITDALGDTGTSLQHLLLAIGLLEGNDAESILSLAKSHLRVARIVEKQEQPARAKRHFDAAVETALRAIAEEDRARFLTQQQVRGLEIATQVELARGQAPRAIRRIRDHLERLTEAETDLQILLADCHRALEDFAAERRALQRASELSQEKFDAETDAPKQVRWATDIAELEEQLAMAFDAEGLTPQAEEHWDVAQQRWRHLLQAEGAEPEPDPARQIRYCQRLQMICSRLADWEQGIVFTQQLLKLRQQALLPDDPSIYRATSALGAFHARSGQFEEAQPFLETALTYWQQRGPAYERELAATMNNLAEVHRNLGQITEAYRLLRRLVPVYKSLYRPLDLELAEAHLNLASVLLAQGNFREAREYYRRAEIISAAEKNRSRLRAKEIRSTALLNMAMLYKSQGQLLDAAQTCKEALEVRLQITAEGDPDRLPYYLAAATLFVALTSNPLDDLEVLLRHLNEAEQFAESADSLIEPNGLQGTPPAAEVQHILALIEFRRGELKTDSKAAQEHYNQAETYWREAAALARQSGNKIVEVKSLSYRVELAMIDAKRQLARAADAQRRAIAIKNEIAEATKETPNNDNAAESSEGATARQGAIDKEAVERYRQEFDRYRQEFEQAMRDYERAFEKANHLSMRAQNMIEDVRAYPTLRFVILLNRARLLRRNAEVLRRGAKMAGQDTSPEADVNHRNAIQLLTAAIRLVEAPRAATTGAERERAKYFAQFSPAFDLLVDWYAKDEQNDLAFEVAELRRNRTFLEQVKAGGIDLRETLPPEQRSLIEEERRISEEYSQLREQLRREAQGGQPSSSRTSPEGSSSLQRLQELEDNYAAIRREIRAASPHYQKVLFETQQEEFSAAALQAREGLVTEKSLALVYYLGVRRSHVFLVDGSGEIKHIPLEIYPEQARDLGEKVAPGPLTSRVAVRLVNRTLFYMVPPDAFTVRRGLGSDPVRVKTWEVSSDRASDFAETFAEVILPTQVRNEIRQRRPEYLTIIPDGALQQLPFEALLLNAREKTYVLDELPPLHYAPSALIMDAVRRRAANRTEEATGTDDWSLLTVAPRYSQVDLDEAQRAARAMRRPSGPTTSRDGAGQHRSRTGLPRSSLARDQIEDYFALGGSLAYLPSARAESEEIYRHFANRGDGNLRRLEGEHATEANVREFVKGKRYVHFATHGLVDEYGDNLFGAIALTLPDGNVTSAENDGFLSLYEIYRLPLGACDLAILSACQTNCGPERPLEAGSTLARAFMAAGARRVVSSHWKVDDQATKHLVTRFVENFVKSDEADEAINYAVALHRAKKAIRNQEEWSSPEYWAPFVLLGPAD